MKRRALVVVLVGVALGCEENLAPRDHFETPFSLYGVLSPDLGTQSIRLYPLEDFPTLGTPEAPDGEVTSIDLQTSERRVWQDSVLVDANGQHEYVFWSAFRAERGHTYRVEARRRADGATSYADVRIPPPPTVRIVDDQDASAVQVLIAGEDIRVFKPEVGYAVRAACCADAQLLLHSFSYEGREYPVAQGWRVDVNLVVDKEKLRFEYRVDNLCPAFILHDLELHIVVGDAVWDPPGGVFDRDILSHPQTMSNVVNGFGFIGGGYRITSALFPSREAVEYACFQYVW